MHLTALARRRMAAGLMALAGLTAAPVAAQQPAAADPPIPPAQAQTDVRVDTRTGALLVPLGGVGRFTPPRNAAIREVINRNEDVLDARVDPASPRTLLLIGRRPGASRLTLVQGGRDDETRAVFDVVVQPDYELLRNVIRQAVPTASVELIPGVGNSVILSGYVSKPEDSDRVQQIASAAVGGTATNVINALQVGGVQHVLIDLTLAQVDRTELRERGFSFGVTGSNFGFGSVLGALGTNNAVTNLFAGGAGGILQPPLTPGANANIQFGIVPANVVGALRALRSEGLAKFLSEPKLVTQTGRPAFFRSGGQQATLGPASGINGPGVVLQPVGTELEVLPIVFGNGKIYLEVNPRVTSVNNGRGITTAFGFTPGFNEQQTRASVMLESGQTFAIGGLIETQVQANSQKVPYLGELPIFSWPWSFTSFQEVETELLVMVTPRLVEPMDCAQVPRRVPTKETRSPDDYELFLEQLLEAPRGQRQVWNGKCYNAAWKCDPSAAVYPCVGNVCTGPNGAAGCANGACGVPAGGPLVPAMTPVAAQTPLLTPVPDAMPAPTAK